jgi:glucose-6-phosphate 1-dehydrogenase
MIVIFGATVDLTKRLVVPALYTLEQTWRIVQPVLEEWAADCAADLPIYLAGSSGPGEADALLARGGRHWRSINGGGAGHFS